MMTISMNRQKIVLKARGQLQRPAANSGGARSASLDSISVFVVILVEMSRLV